MSSVPRQPQSKSTPSTTFPFKLKLSFKSKLPKHQSSIPSKLTKVATQYEGSGRPDDETSELLSSPQAKPLNTIWLSGSSAGCFGSKAENTNDENTVQSTINNEQEIHTEVTGTPNCTSIKSSSFHLSLKWSRFNKTSNGKQAVVDDSCGEFTTHTAAFGTVDQSLEPSSTKRKTLVRLCRQLREVDQINEMNIATHQKIGTDEEEPRAKSQDTTTTLAANNVNKSLSPRFCQQKFKPKNRTLSKKSLKSDMTMLESTNSRKAQGIDIPSAEASKQKHNNISTIYNLLCKFKRWRAFFGCLFGYNHKLNSSETEFSAPVSSRPQYYSSSPRLSGTLLKQDAQRAASAVSENEARLTTSPGNPPDGGGTDICEPIHFVLNYKNDDSDNCKTLNANTSLVDDTPTKAIKPNIGCRSVTMLFMIVVFLIAMKVSSTSTIKNRFLDINRKNAGDVSYQWKAKESTQLSDTIETHICKVKESDKMLPNINPRNGHFRSQSLPTKCKEQTDRIDGSLVDCNFTGTLKTNVAISSSKGHVDGVSTNETNILAGNIQTLNAHKTSSNDCLPIATSVEEQTENSAACEDNSLDGYEERITSTKINAEAIMAKGDEEKNLPLLKRLPGDLVPIELWIAIIKNASYSLQEFAEYTRTSRQLRRIFWTPAVKAHVMSISNFAGLGMTDLVAVEANASQMLKAASSDTGITCPKQSTWLMKFKQLITFLSHDDAVDVVQRLICTHALQTLLNLESRILGVKPGVRGRRLRLQQREESNFEKMWTRAAYDSGNWQGQDRTLLHFAAEFGSLKVAKVLVEAGTKVNCFDSNGISPLHVAIKASQLDMVKYIAGVIGPEQINLCARIETGVTPLSLATLLRRIHVMKILINFGASIYVTDFDKSTLVHVAARSDSVEILKFLHSHWHSGFSLVKGRSGQTPLFGAVCGNSPKCFTYLLDAGCRDDMKFLLKVACEVGAFKCLELLLKMGIPMELRNRRILRIEPPCSQETWPPSVTYADTTWTHLNLSILSKQDKIVRFLVDKARCSVNLCTSWGQSPFYTAAGEIGDISLAKFLLCRGAQWDTRLKTNGGTSARSGFSALHRAVQRLDVEAVKFLVELWRSTWYSHHKGETNIKHASTLPTCIDSYGSNPLHIIAGLGVNGKEVKEIINVLAAVRPDWLNAIDINLKIPWSVAYDLNRSDTNRELGFDALQLIGQLLRRSKCTSQ
ncbi:hypothetical protein HDU76_001887 [Blyttiomyces sp. JEL0837]|nr:hypothetical protein HDU76_001887 [Blyttiomyces sp. JEL0837]